MFNFIIGRTYLVLVWGTAEHEVQQNMRYSSNQSPPLSPQHIHTEKRMLCYSIQQHWCLICIHQSWFIWYPNQQLPSMLLVHDVHHMPVTSCSCRLQQSVPNIPVSFCYIWLIQSWQPNRLFQSDTVSSEQSVGDNSLIQLRYHICIRPERATACNRSVAFLRV